MAYLVKVYSLNVRGIHSKKTKRLKHFHNFKKKYPNSFIFLQETHSSKDIEIIWSREWGGEIIYAHGSTSSRGVAILCPHNIEYKLDKIIADTNGRYLFVKILVGDEEFLLANTYAPSGEQAEKLSFLSEYKNILAQHNQCTIVLGGDFNIHLNPALDYRGNRRYSDNFAEYRLEVLSMLETYDLVDVWRLYNGDTFRFTWHCKKKKIFSRLDYLFLSEHLLNRVEKVCIQAD